MVEVTEITSVANPTNVVKPIVVLSSTEAGSVSVSLEGTSLTINPNTFEIDRLENQTFTISSASDGDLEEGIYTGLVVKVTDSAGNVGSLTLTEFVIDTTVPNCEATIVASRDGNNLTVQSGMYYAQEDDVLKITVICSEIVVTEYPILTIGSSSAKTLATSSSVDGNVHTIIYTYTIEQDDTGVVNLIFTSVKDLADNESTVQFTYQNNIIIKNLIIILKKQSTVKVLQNLPYNEPGVNVIENGKLLTDNTYTVITGSSPTLDTNNIGNTVITYQAKLYDTEENFVNESLIITRNVKVVDLLIEQDFINSTNNTEMTITYAGDLDDLDYNVTDINGNNARPVTENPETINVSNLADGLLTVSIGSTTSTDSVIKDTIIPDGHTVKIDQPYITPQNSELSFTFISDEVDGTYSASVTDISGTSISSTGIVSSEINSLILGDVANLTDGVLSLSATLIDVAGNPAIPVTSVVQKINHEPPTIELIENSGNNNIIDVGGTYTEYGATATDNFPGREGNSLGVIFSDNTVDTNTLGTYLITYTTTDSVGIESSISRTVHVIDRIPPVITLIGNKDVYIQVSSDKYNYTELDFTVTDNADTNTFITSITGLDITDTLGNKTMDTSVIGNTTIIYTAIDSVGNKATETRTVHVINTINPKITMTGTDVEHEFGKIYKDDGATAVDYEDNPLPVTTFGTQIIEDAANTAITYRTLLDNSIGSHTITYIASDDSKNTSVATRTVTVVDSLIHLTGDQELVVELSDMDYTDPGAYIYKDGTYVDILTTSIIGLSNVDQRRLGSTIITYSSNINFGTTLYENTIQDSNTELYLSDFGTTITRTIHVVDTTVPVLNLTGSEIITVEVGSTYVDEGLKSVIDFDFVTGNTGVSGLDSIDTSITGDFTITYSAWDTHNTGYVTRTVQVRDNTAPVITVLEPTSNTHITFTSASENYYKLTDNPYFDPGATVSDIGHGTSITYTTFNEEYVELNITGDYKVTYVAQDASGNASIKTRNVYVREHLFPTIDLNTDITLELGDKYTDTGITAYDNIITNRTSTTLITAGSSSDLTGIVFDGKVLVDTSNNTITNGDTTITYSFTNSIGNETTVTRTVFVRDNSKPTITLKGENEINIELNDSFEDPGWTVTDNDSNITVVTGSSQPFNADVIGSTIITYQAEDSSGNTSIIERTVNVTAIPEQISMPSAIYLVPGQSYIFIPTKLESSKIITYKYKYSSTEPEWTDMDDNMLTLDPTTYTHDSILYVNDSYVETQIKIYHSIILNEISDFYIGADNKTLNITTDTNITGGSGQYNWISHITGGSGQYNWTLNNIHDTTANPIYTYSPNTSYSKIFSYSDIGKYELTATDITHSSISRTRYFEVKSLEVNIGFQGKTTTAGDSHNFIGGLYSKDNKMFNFFHNKDSALSSIENITTVSGLEYAPIKSKNLSSTDIIDNTFNSTLLLNSNDYEISSDGKTVVEIFNGYNTCHVLILKTHVFDDSSGVYFTKCTNVCMCSTSDPSNPFENDKLTLSTSGKFVCVSYKIGVKTEFKIYNLSTTTDSSNFIDVSVITTDINESSPESKLDIINNNVNVSDLYISDTHLIVLEEVGKFHLYDFIHNVKTKNSDYITSPSKVSLNDRNKIFISNDSQIECIDWKRKTYFPVSTQINGDNFDITFSLYDTEFINEYFGVGDIINYDNIDYKIIACLDPNPDGYAVVSILNNAQLLPNKVVNIVHFTTKVQPFTTKDLLNIDNNQNMFSRVINSNTEITTSIQVDELREDGTINHIETLDLNLYKSFDKLCVNLNGHSTFSIGTYENSTKQLAVKSYEFNNTLNIGSKANANNNNIVIGHNTTTTGHNQIVIGSRSSGKLDNSITLGNNETTSMVPRNNRVCNIGDNDYRINTFIGDNIAFGNDHMNLPKSDGFDHQVLVRKGENNLEWGNVARYVDNLIDGYSKTDRYNVHLPTPDGVVLYSNVFDVTAVYNTEPYTYADNGQITFKPEKQLIWNNGSDITYIFEHTTKRYKKILTIDPYELSETEFITQDSETLFYYYNPGLTNSITDDNGDAYIHLKLKKDCGEFNTCYGYQTGQHLSFGSNNTAIGYNSGSIFTTGSENTLLGSNSGTTLITGSGNTLIGHNSHVTGTDSDNSKNRIAVGNNSEVFEDNTCVIGNTAITGIYPGNHLICDLGEPSHYYRRVHCKNVYAEESIMCKGPVYSYSDKSLKSDIKTLENCTEFIESLQPVEYTLNKQQTKHLGFIAQEVKENVKKSNFNDNVITKQDDNGLLVLNYQEIIAPLVQTVQDQNKMIQDLQKRLQLLENK